MKSKLVRFSRKTEKLKAAKAKRTLRERHFREWLRRHRSEPVDPLVTGMAPALKCTLDELERRYDETDNPVCVWEAIAFAVELAKADGSPVILPDWILAYLFWASFEIGLAAQRPERDHPEAKPKKIDGVTHQYSTAFYGMTAEERTETIAYALRFKDGSARNLLLQASRRRAKEADVHAILSAIKEASERDVHLTVQAAIEQMGVERYLKGGASRFYADKRELRGKT